MFQKDPSAHLTEALIRAETLRKAAPGEEGLAAPRAFTIALSREAGALGTSVARAVGARLGWAVYDHEIIEKIAQDLNVRVDLLERIDERPASWLEEALAGFAGGTPASEIPYFRRLLNLLISLGARGECVIVGRGAVLLLPATTTLRVRLFARLEDRVAVMSRELGIPREEAARYVEKTDRERLRFVKEHFQKDLNDPQHYDLVLNTSRFSVPDCATLIIEALHRLQAHTAATR